MFIKKIDIENNKECKQIRAVIKNFLEKSSVLVN